MAATAVRQKLLDLAGVIAAITDEDYHENPTELFDGSDVDALTAAAASLDPSADVIQMLRGRVARSEVAILRARDLLERWNLGKGDKRVEDDTMAYLESERSQTLNDGPVPEDGDETDDEIRHCESCKEVIADGDEHTTSDEVALCGECFRGIFGGQD